MTPKSSVIGLSRPLMLIILAMLGAQQKGLLGRMPVWLLNGIKNFLRVVSVVFICKVQLLLFGRWLISLEMRPWVDHFRNACQSSSLGAVIPFITTALVVAAGAGLSLVVRGLFWAASFSVFSQAADSELMASTTD